MDKNLEKIRRLHIKECMKNLERNNMKAFFAKDKKEVLDIVKSLVKEGEKVSVGGSMSLFECGVIDFLKNGNFRFLDRYKEGLTREEIEKIYRESFFCDHYFTSANAITRDGCLYNVDGNSNRVAAMLYGPKSVIVIAGA
ncbi:MAG: lactate utilization protein, partial [Clostridiaceae bacterium]|nr:lactate utilization protein [Clostridiaceae bacterium]